MFFKILFGNRSVSSTEILRRSTEQRAGRVGPLAWSRTCGGGVWPAGAVLQGKKSPRGLEGRSRASAYVCFVSKLYMGYKSALENVYNVRQFKK